MLGSRNISAGSAVRLRVPRHRKCDSIPSRDNRLLFHSFRTASGRHAASYTMRAGISDWWEKRPGPDVLHACLVSRLRMSKAVPPLPSIFLPHGLHRDNLIANLVPGAFNLRPNAK